MYLCKKNPLKNSKMYGLGISVHCIIARVHTGTKCFVTLLLQGREHMLFKEIIIHLYYSLWPSCLFKKDNITEFHLNICKCNYVKYNEVFRKAKI